jgi:hypothetical protein
MLRRKKFLVLNGLIFLLFSFLGSAPWWDENWSYRRNISITHINQQPELIVIRPSSADAYLRERHTGENDTNFGAQELISLHDDNTHGWDTHGVIRFNLPEEVTNFLSAELRLCVASTEGGDSVPNRGTFFIHRITQSWEENTITCRNSIGSRAENKNDFCSTTPTDQVEISAVPRVGSWISFNVTSDVQHFLSGTPNYGWYLFFKDSWKGGLSFYSKEAPDLLLRPQLLIYCNTPLPKNYSIKVVLDTRGEKFLETGNDLRIVYLAGGEYLELPWVNETSFNSSQTEIWFPAQKEIKSGETDSDYWIYYGNPQAGIPLRDPNKVYLFWDDFERYQEGTSPEGWKGETENFKVHRHASGTKALKCIQGEQPNPKKLIIDANWRNYLVSVDILTEQTSGTSSRGIIACETSKSPGYRYSWQEGTEEAVSFYLTQGEQILQNENLSIAFLPQVWHTLTLAVFNDKIYPFYDHQMWGSEYLNPSPQNEGGAGVFSNKDEKAWYDNVKVRYYFPDEPRVEIGGEESKLSNSQRDGFLGKVSFLGEHPNPKYFSYYSKMSRGGKIEVYNLLGQRVNGNALSFNSPSGIYFYRLKIDGQVVGVTRGVIIK